MINKDDRWYDPVFVWVASSIILGVIVCATILDIKGNRANEQLSKDDEKTEVVKYHASCGNCHTD